MDKNIRKLPSGRIAERLLEWVLSGGWKSWWYGFHPRQLICDDGYGGLSWVSDVNVKMLRRRDRDRIDRLGWLRPIDSSELIRAQTVYTFDLVGQAGSISKLADEINLSRAPEENLRLYRHLLNDRGYRIVHVLEKLLESDIFVITDQGQQDLKELERKVRQDRKRQSAPNPDSGEAANKERSAKPAPQLGDNPDTNPTDDGR